LLLAERSSSHSPRFTVETHGTVAAFDDGFPVTKGHLLIVPLRHTDNGFSMTEQEIRDCEALIRTLSDKIRKSDPSAWIFHEVEAFI
jgi:diadenosine tetraphosphate (Ap4A) HIT family hydrolase